jgi:hypothetical protein
MISCDDEEFELERADEGEGGERKKFEVELKSKKQWSLQWQELAKRIRSRNEQYTQGRLRKYVQTKNRRIKIGDAFVGMNRSGSQLDSEVLGWDNGKTPGRANLLRQNILVRN